MAAVAAVIGAKAEGVPIIIGLEGVTFNQRPSVGGSRLVRALEGTSIKAREARCGNGREASSSAAGRTTR